MCYICDGKRDLRVMASVITLISAIDFDRARMVLMARKIAAERIREIVEEQGVDEHGGAFLDLDTLLAEEDEDTNAIKASMAMSMIMQDALGKVDAAFRAYGPFVVPAVDDKSESADAFSAYIDQMFSEGGEHEEDDEEQEV